MDTSQPANNRTSQSTDPHCRDEDEVAMLLAQVLGEPCSEEIVFERWNRLAERIVADLEVHLAQRDMEVRRAEIRRLGLVLQSLSSLTVQLA